MSTLRNTINELAAKLAAGVLEAIRGASLEELLNETGGSGAAFTSGGAAAVVRRGPGRPSKAAAVASEGAGPVAAPARGRGRRRGRLARRSAGDISKVVDSIVSLLAANLKGLRAEEIRKKLDLDSKELPRPIAEALATHRISKQGQKRATTYFAGKAGKAGGSKAASAPKAKAAKKAKKAKSKGKAKAKRAAKPSKKAAPTRHASAAVTGPGDAHSNGQSAAAMPADVPSDVQN